MVLAGNENVFKKPTKKSLPFVVLISSSKPLIILAWLSFAITMVLYSLLERSVVLCVEIAIDSRAANVVESGCFREALQKYPEQSFAQKFSLCNRQKFSGAKLKRAFEELP